MEDGGSSWQTSASSVTNSQLETKVATAPGSSPMACISHQKTPKR